MNYFTPTNLPRQALNSQIDSDPTAFLSNSLTHKEKLVFKEYFSVCQNYEKVYISHETIAARVGCSLSTVKRAVRRFKELGVLDSIYRHMDTCEYSMNEFFFTKETRKKLSSVFRYFVPLALSLLALGSNELQLKLKDKDFINNEVVTVSNDARSQVVNDVELTLFCKNLRKKRMNAETSDKIREIMKRMPMTTHGMLRLSVYPPKVLHYAMAALDKALANDDPFVYFLRVCDYFCTQNRIQQDHVFYKSSQKALGIAPNTPFTKEDDLAPFRLTPAKKVAPKLKRPERESYKHPVRLSTETDYECAFKLAKINHEQLLKDPRSDFFSLVPNTKFNWLTLDEQQTILQEVHTSDCPCPLKATIQAVVVPPVEDVVEKIISRPSTISQLYEALEIDYSAYEEIY